MSRRRVGIVSLGCAKNLVDTEVMMGHLDRSGDEFVQDPAEAEVLVINTCSFIEPAREESIQTILDAARLKKTGRLRRLIVAGCMVQRYADELKREMPEVDDFIGLDELHRVTDRAGSPSLPMASPAAGNAAAPTPARYLYDHATPRRLATPSWTAYVKIAEGCDHTCAFCAIPSFRGKFRSREADSIVVEASQLAETGVREINLIAQDSSHYGRDRQGGDDLPSLLRSLDSIEGLRWIRVHYLYPNSVTDRLIATMANARRIVDYIDLPLQHANRATLARMRRGGSITSHLELLGRIRQQMPLAALRTTLITGFPGETEEEFETLLEFVREARLSHLGVFTYSHERGTGAFELEDDVPEATKRERRDRVMDCQQRIAFAATERLVGKRFEVLVEGAHPETDHLLVGRMASQGLDVDGQVLINDGAAEPGEFVQVEMTEAAGYDVVGRIVAPAWADPGRGIA